MLRRCLALLVAATLLAVGSASVAEGAKRRAENPRLHAFRSCTNLLTYAQRNGTRIIRDTPLSPVSPPPRPLPVEDNSGAGEGGGGSAPQAPQPVSGREEAPAESPTNVQEQGVDEPDWVKASGSTVLVAAGERLHALDARTTPPTKLDSIPLAGGGNELLVHGNRALAITRMGFGGGGDAVAAQGGIVPPQQWLGRTRFTEIDISDPRALKIRKTYDVEGDYLERPADRRDGARGPDHAGRAGIEMPETNPGLTPSVVRRRWVRSVRRTRTRAWLPAGILRDRRTGRRAPRGRALPPGAPHQALHRARHHHRAHDRHEPRAPGDRRRRADDRGTPSTRARTGCTSPRSAGWARTPRARSCSTSPPPACTRSRQRRPGARITSAAARSPATCSTSGRCPSTRASCASPRRRCRPGTQGARTESAVRTLEEREGRLTQLGAVGGLGAGERIYAVRFMGDTGYVVTFRQTDPLYVIDLANPRAPRWSASSRSPATRPTCTRSATGCCSASVRTLTSRAAPRACSCRCSTSPTRPVPTRLDQEGLGEDTFTEVENDHHAFLWWAPEKLAVLPLLAFTSRDAGTFAGAAAFRVDRAGGIQRVATIDAGDEPFSRSLVLGDRLLLVSNAGVLSTAVAAPAQGAFTAF